MQRRHHYEQAFGAYLRRHRIPYVAVDEARKAILPDNAHPAGNSTDPAAPPRALKSFDFVIYTDPASTAAPDTNLLVDIKGRKVARRTGADPLAPGRLENWVTRDDVDSLAVWERLFGDAFRAAFVFLYWCHAQPPDGLFQQVFEHKSRWYALRTITLAAYTRKMKVRSPKWGTMHLAATDFEELSQPLLRTTHREPDTQGRIGSPADWHHSPSGRKV